MKKILVLLVATLSIAPLANATQKNRINSNGKRIGLWVLDANNKPISGKSKKVSEGKYVNGRKEGVWIFYHQDGKTPRLIGEYADNRPSGTYFRFTEKGKLKQASAVERKLKATNRISSKNSIFNCQLNFENKEIVAGQVYFSKQIIPNNSIKFWVAQSLECMESKSSTSDFNWLNTNYPVLRETFIAVRTPGGKKVINDSGSENSIADNTRVESKLSPEQNLAKQGNYFYAPVVKNPRLAKGMTFQRFGNNKLYTKSNEIWIDGFFKDGRLQDGKVFIYDRDGVLLKVRVYKDGIYESDGVL